ncbi:hypothetical protein HOV12_gp40 [Streptomyces phage Lilbooboo]|uniref:Uncharacterized protein n=1 Tax=Streptomyces phage Lilbooboo TaxID=2510571 RepID=A0A411B328_9CAUD|nr:hypothetical protein HOV12_gp40 [Streptomyces phage Lilbooboo]QAX94752.1 hypothetical protein SEA_LILBOOBOO_53 [Streptomyces phage Lilbooboo]
MPQNVRRLPWTGPNGEAEYAAPGEVDNFADAEEAHMISTARNDARYALAMVDRPDVTHDDLRKLVRDLVDHVVCIARVADLREERLKDPSYGPAVRAIEGALRKALPTR